MSGKNESAAYQHQKFPTVRYHPDHPPVTVQNAKAEKELGPGWFDSPAKCPDREAEREEVRRGYRERVEAAVGNPGEQSRILNEYRTLHPDVTAIDSWYKLMEPQIPNLLALATLDLAAKRQVTKPEQPSKPREGTAPAEKVIPVKGSPEERAKTVALIIAELNTLKPQMYGDCYAELRDGNGDFLTFKITDQRNDLKVKLVNIQESKRHIRLAQECAAHYHGIQLETIKTDWKRHKPENFRS